MKLFLIISFLTLVSFGHSGVTSDSVIVNDDGTLNIFFFTAPPCPGSNCVPSNFSNFAEFGLDSDYGCTASNLTPISLGGGEYEFQNVDISTCGFIYQDLIHFKLFVYSISGFGVLTCDDNTFEWVLPTPTPSITPTVTPTSTRTQTFTFSPTVTPTPSKTITNTFTFSPTITMTPTVTNTFQNSSTLTPTPTWTITLTPTPTWTQTSTPTNTYSPTSTGTWTKTITDTFTFSPTISATSTITATYTFTPTATRTLTPAPYLVTAYYNDISFTTFLCSTLTSQVNFFFSATFNMPAIPSGINPNTWACTYVGMIIPTTTEAYTFQATVDDGTTITMDGFDVISSWSVKSPTTFTSAPRNFTSGVPVYVRIQYYHDSADFSQLNLKWKAASFTGGVYKIVPGSKLWH